MTARRWLAVAALAGLVACGGRGAGSVPSPDGGDGPPPAVFTGKGSFDVVARLTPGAP
jgi:hypothetical protein